MKNYLTSRIAAVVLGSSVLIYLVSSNIPIASAFNPQFGSTPTCTITRTGTTSLSVTCSGTITGLEGLSQVAVGIAVASEAGCMTNNGQKAAGFTRAGGFGNDRIFPVSDGQTSFSLQQTTNITPVRNCPPGLTLYNIVTNIIITVRDPSDPNAQNIVQLQVPGPYTIT